MTTKFIEIDGTYTRRTVAGGSPGNIIVDLKSTQPSTSVNEIRDPFTNDGPFWPYTAVNPPENPFSYATITSITTSGAGGTFVTDKLDEYLRFVSHYTPPENQKYQGLYIQKIGWALGPTEPPEYYEIASSIGNTVPGGSDVPPTFTMTSSTDVGVDLDVGDLIRMCKVPSLAEGEYESFFPLIELDGPPDQRIYQLDLSESSKRNDTVYSNKLLVIWYNTDDSENTYVWGVTGNYTPNSSTLDIYRYGLSDDDDSIIQAPPASGLFSIWENVQDTNSPILYGNNALIERNVFYNINVKQIVIPNPLRFSDTNELEEYPYLYIRIGSELDTVADIENVIFTNNPNERIAVFRVLLENLPTSSDVGFIRYTIVDGINQTIKFTNNDTISIRIDRPDGLVFNTGVKTSAPLPPLPDVNYTLLLELTPV